MRIQELVEARRNASQYPQVRGIHAVIDYLERALASGRRRMFVHSSLTPKIGLKPVNRMMMEENEVAGIYTYPADYYLEQIKDDPVYRDTDYGGNFPYVTVITLKDDARILSRQQYRKIIDFSHRPILRLRSTGEELSSFQFNRYFQSLGYGVIERLQHGPDYVILGTNYIKQIRQFQVQSTHNIQDVRVDDDDVEPRAEYNNYTPQYRERLERFIGRLKQDPDFQKVDPAAYSELVYLEPEELAAARLLIHAIKTQRILSPADLQRIPQDAQMFSLKQLWQSYLDLVPGARQTT